MTEPAVYVPRHLAEEEEYEKRLLVAMMRRADPSAGYINTHGPKWMVELRIGFARVTRSVAATTPGLAAVVVTGSMLTAMGLASWLDIWNNGFEELAEIPVASPDDRSLTASSAQPAGQQARVEAHPPAAGDPIIMINNHVGTLTAATDVLGVLKVQAAVNTDVESVLRSALRSLDNLTNRQSPSDPQAKPTVALTLRLLNSDPVYVALLAQEPLIVELGDTRNLQRALGIHAPI